MIGMGRTSRVTNLHEHYAIVLRWLVVVEEDYGGGEECEYPSQ